MRSAVLASWGRVVRRMEAERGRGSVDAVGWGDAAGERGEDGDGGIFLEREGGGVVI